MKVAVSDNSGYGAINNEYPHFEFTYTQRINRQTMNLVKIYEVVEQFNKTT